MKNEFVSVVGHELRTPLTSIRGSLGLLAGGIAGELPPEAAQMVQLAVDNTDRLVRLVNDTLELERLDAGRMELDRRPSALDDVTATALHAVDALAGAAGVSLVSTVGGIRLLADPDRIVQALVNLLGNAVKFSPRGGSVTRVGRAARAHGADLGRPTRVRGSPPRSSTASSSASPRSTAPTPATRAAPGSGWRSRARSSSATAGGSGPRTAPTAGRPSG